MRLLNVLHLLSYFYEYVIKKTKRGGKKKSKRKWQPHQGWRNKKIYWICPKILQLTLKNLNHLWDSFLYTGFFLKKVFLRKVEVLNNMLSMCEVEVFLVVRVTSASLSQRGQAAQLASCPTGAKTRDLGKDFLGQGQKREECQALRGGDGDRSYKNVPDLGSLENCTPCSWSANWEV